MGSNRTAKNLVFILFGIIFFSVVFLLLDNEDFGDSNVIYLADSNSGYYYSPPCLMSSNFDDVKSIREFAKANDLVVFSRKTRKSLGLDVRPNPDCANEAGYNQKISTIGRYCVKRGYLKWLYNSRWNKDGTWNW
jgi:hypothetical protein